MSGFDFQIGDVFVKADFPNQGEAGGTSASGIWTFQNSTPTDVRFQNSEPGFGDTAPYSARTYANQSGSIGKQNEIQAPADLARPYQCDLDNSRPGYIAPRLTWEQGLNVLFDPTPGAGNVNSSPWTLADTSLYGMGVLVSTNGGTDAGLWLYEYNIVSRHYSPVSQINLHGTTLKAPYIPQFRQQVRTALPYGVIRETSNHVWVPITAGGAVDALLPFATQAQIQFGTQFWHFVSFGGYVFSFEQTFTDGVAAGMTVSLRSTDGLLTVLNPATLSNLDASPELGNAPIQALVPDVICAFTPVVYGGAIYVCTDRQVLKVVYDDNNARIMVVPVHTSFTRITGNPEIFQGSLFVPSGNILWKWTPGQLEFTAIPVDAFGDLPENRGGGTISALRAVANGLMVALQSSPPDKPDATLLKMDTNNTFQMYDYASDNGCVKAGVLQQLIHFVDAAYDNAGTVVGFVTASAATGKRVVPVRESSRDPIFQLPAKRPQVAGSHWWISAVDPGVNYGDFKQALRVAAACADVSTLCKIRIYYQIDYEGIYPDQFLGTGAYAGPTVGTLMEGMGRWHLAMILDNTNGQLTNTSGGAYAGYAQTSLVWPTVGYRSIRWAVEMIGDPSGNLYPRLMGLKHYYSETPAMYIVHSLRIRIMVDDPDLADAPTSGLFPPPRTTTDVYNHFRQLYDYAKAGAFVWFADANGDGRYAKITKLIFNGTDLADTSTGIPGDKRYRKMVLQLALQEGDSAA